MSTIRLHGSTSGHYDVTVPAVAGTNSIDLSTLVTTNSSGNLTLDGNLTVQGQFEVHKDYNANYYKKDDGTTLGYILFRDNGPCYYEYNSTNSGQDFRFASNNQTKWTLDATGRMFVAAQPSFAARLSSNWSHPSGVRAIEGTWSTIHNVGNHWDNTTRRFTAPVAGTYLFTAIVGTVGGVTGVSYISAEVWVNGARGNHMTGGWDSGGSSYNQNSNAYITQLSAGDYVQLASEININCTIQSGSHTQLRGYLLG